MVFDVKEYSFEKFEKIPLQHRKRGHKILEHEHDYLDAICAFDIETSRVPFTKQAIMYIWQFQINDDTIIGRTWDEFMNFIHCLQIRIVDGARIVVYVHNLSYEFQFLSGIYKFAPEEVFAVKKRKILKCTMYDKIEFRCSYLLTNSSLENFTKTMQVEHIKRPGEDINHNKFRTPQTPLNDKELQYCYNDVIGLCEALSLKMQHDKDNLYSIPLTSTGYVRRDTKRAMRTVSHDYIKNIIPPYEVYVLLREAFRGGNTHANRFFVGRILDNVKSADRSSSYPDVQINCQFPISAFEKLDDCSVENVIYEMEKRKKAILCRVAFTNIRLHDKYWGFPYLSKDKCRKLEKDKDWKGKNLYDNGRILRSDYLETTVTDIDLKIILKEYDFDSCVFDDVYTARYGELPPVYKYNIISYYKAKTELKGIEDEFYNYNRAKAMLNSIYGMSAQDPIKQSIDYMWEDIIEPFHEQEKDPQELYETYIKKAFLPYQWGVWTTALARYRLEEGLEIAGDNGIYCDTDSVKYIGDADFSKYNAQRIKDSKEHGSCAIDKKGKTHYMGVFEAEDTYKKFKTYGAKKYIYQYEEGVTCITIAGVDKKKGGKELDEQGAKVGKSGMDMLEPGFKFYDAGGTTAIYNDEVDLECENIYTNGIPMKVTRNIYLDDDVYTVGIVKDYESLLAACEVNRGRELWKY